MRGQQQYIYSRNSFNFLFLLLLLVFSELFFSCKKREPILEKKLTQSWSKVVEDCDSLIFNGQKEIAKQRVYEEFRKIEQPTVLDSCYYYRFWQWLYSDVDIDYGKAIDYVDSIRMILIRNQKEEEYANFSAMVYYWKGDIFFATGNYKEAYNSYYAGKNVASLNYDPCELANFYYRLGMVLYKQERYDQSIGQFFESLKLSQSCGKRFDFCYRTQEIIDNIGLCYYHLEKTDSALIFYQKGIHYLDFEVPNTTPLQDTLCEIAKGVIYGNMGTAYESLGNDSAAISLYKLNIAINKSSVREIKDAIKTELKLANIYLKKKEFLNFWYTIEDSRVLLEKHYDPSSQQKYFELMATHLLDRDSILALQYFLQSKRLNDSLNLLEKNIQSIDLKSHIDDLEKQNEISELQKNNKQKILFLTIAISVAILSVAIIFLVVFYMNRLRKFLKEKGLFNTEVTRQKTELEKTLHKLEIAYQEKDKILHIVAHDLRSPINSIMALADLLLHDDTLNKDQREPLEMIVSACQNSLGLSKEILESAVLMQSKELSLTEINFNELLANIVSLLRFKATEKQIQLDLQLTHQHYYLTIDKDKIHQVFNNLITNAIKFSKHDSTIYISMKKERDGLLILVKDFGIGIPEKIQAKIFDMFTESKREGTAGEKAYGLGLSISKQIIETHGGNIWFESNDGIGTTFYAYLPFSFKAPEI